MLKKQTCDHSDTRLKCNDCEQPVCPKCMVQCPVGVRCKTCSPAAKTSSSGDLNPVMMIKVVCLSFIASFLISFAETAVMMVMPICLLCGVTAAVTGYFSGKLIYKIANPSDGKQLVPFLIIPLILGFIVNPLSQANMYVSMCCSGAAVPDSTILLQTLLTPGIAIFTIVIPFTARKFRPY